MILTDNELSDKVKALAQPKTKEELNLLGAEFHDYNGEPQYAAIMRDDYTATFSYRSGWYHLHDYHDVKESHSGVDLNKTKNI